LGYIYCWYLYISSSWLISHRYLPQYSFKNITPLLSEKKVIGVKYIMRTKEAYIFTDSNELYIYDVDEMRQNLYRKLNLSSKIKKILCSENRCRLSTDKGLSIMEIDQFSDNRIYIHPPKTSPIDIDQKDILDIVLQDSQMSLEKIAKLQEEIGSKKFELMDPRGSMSLTAYYRKHFQIILIKQNNITRENLFYHYKTLLNLHDIDELAFDSMELATYKSLNVIFMDTNGKLFKAQTKNSIFQYIYEFTKPFAYMPMLILMGFG